MSRSVRSLNDARTIVNQEQTIAVGGGMARFGLPVQYVIQAPNFARLKEILPKFLEEANDHPAFSAVDLN